MPFKSKAQMGWFFSNKPQTAKKWANETPNIKALPKKVGPPKMKASTYSGMMKKGRNWDA